MVCNINKKDSKGLLVYLAGGFQSGWQDKVMKKTLCLEYIDPRIHGLDDEKEYTEWDLSAISKSDVVFAYLEPTNPGGYSLALELGYAKALGKYIIFIDEKSTKNVTISNYFGMVRSVANEVYVSLEEGIEGLSKLVGR